MMSSKGKNVPDPKVGKNSTQSRKKNPRRSQRHLSNGDPVDDSKERASKRGRDSNKDFDGNYEAEFPQELYKSVIDLVPSTEYNCEPTEKPAPPGTQVNLHGVILHETQDGLLVLNVRWRNQVFSGALIDVEKTKWASERVSAEGNSELSKFTSTQPPIKKLRIPTSALRQQHDDSDSSGSTKKKAGTTSPTTSGKSKSRTGTSKKRGVTASVEPVSPPPDDPQTTPKKSKVKPLTNGDAATATFECPETNCRKRYKNKNGLAYHMEKTHPPTPKKAESYEEKDIKSDDSDSGDDNFVIDEKAGDDDDEEEENPTEDESKSNVVSQPSSDDVKMDDIKPDNNSESKNGPKTESPSTSETVPMEIDNSTTPKKENEGVKMEKEAKPSVKSEETKNVDIPTPVKDEKPVMPITVVPSVSTLVQSGHSITIIKSSDKNDTKHLLDSKDPKSKMMPTPGGASNIQVMRAAPTTNLNYGQALAQQAPPPSIVVVKSEEERQRQGSTKIIHHADPAEQLNELFNGRPVAQPQGHPPFNTALGGSINPQKFPDGMNTGLSKQQQLILVHQQQQQKQQQLQNKQLPQQNIPLTQQSSASHPTLTTALSTNFLPATSMVNLPLPKPTLSSKPSLEIKPNTYNLLNNPTTKVMGYGEEFFNKPLAGTGSVESRQPLKQEERVDDSDDEGAATTDLVLSAVHRVYPQKEKDLQSTAEPAVLDARPFKVNTVLTTLASVATVPTATFGAGTLSGLIGARPQQGFENALLFKDFASKVANEGANLGANLNFYQGKYPLVISDHQKTVSPQILRPITDSNGQSLTILPSIIGSSNSELKSNVLNINSSAPGGASSIPSGAGGAAESAKTSLLHQRLMLNEDTSAAASNKNFIPPSNVKPNNGAHPSQYGLPTQKQDMSSAASEYRLSNDKVSVTTSMTLTRMPEKMKVGLPGQGGLRINPPPDERGPPSRSQHPDNLKEAMLQPKELSGSSQYRQLPITKSLARGEMPNALFAAAAGVPPSSLGAVASSPSVAGGIDNRRKMLMNRTTSTIPIAPAPPSTTSMSRATDPSVIGSGEYAGPEGNRENYMHRFTLTSDKRLVSSPAENRGRPKKIRVEKTETIPIGTAQEMARSRGAMESPSARSRASESPIGRKVTSPVVRASVIQGQLHPVVGQTSIADHTSPPKNDHHLFQLSRGGGEHGGPVMDERARFGQPAKMSTMDARAIPGSITEKNIKSPPGMGSYYNQPPNQRQRILSPPTSRSPAISPRVSNESIPRSPSPGIFSHEHGKPYHPYPVENREKYGFGHPGGPPGEHARISEQIRKQELHRSVSDQGRVIADPRKSVLSPREGISINPPFNRQLHEDYANFTRHQSPRAEMAPRDIPPRPSSMYEHRSLEDSAEQARILASTRDRFMMAPGLSSQQPLYNVGRSGTPPSSGAPTPSSHHSSNLVLGRADGSILSKNLNYEPSARPGEQKR
ncbi:nuclear pore complex protein DDB_G0274915-like [Clytia hemisphaerica]|uniref:C2H2-type domain-containing protein n=1 Tax=Clytia hemisphaerica TaxID=252671 RepID=A0A7M5VBS0_9CNID